MSENRIHRSSAASSPKKRNGNDTVRKYLIIAVLVIAAILIFVFGINKWKIDFKLIGESSVTSECGEPYKDQGADAEVTGSILSFVHHPISVKVSTETSFPFLSQALIDSLASKTGTLEGIH